MPLSRLDNFLKNARGNILYVNPNDLDATDSIENQGNSLARPFKTIQRALVEASRFSYQTGLDNDRFGKTTILLYPGEHIVDNRPGWIPDGENNYRLRNGLTSSDFGAWSLTTNFDLTSANNALYKLNSVYGGIIIPRGTSIVGLDLRKTKIRPRYVPNPENTSIGRSAVFRVTGGCYLWQFSIFDGDPNGKVYKDYTANEFVPNFSHHKLTVFEYADGVNDVSISDAFISGYDAYRTDLEMYYEKVGLAYGPSSGREIEPDYPSSGVDIQPKIDEYRIVGPRGGEVGISSIKAGDGAISSTTITVTLTKELSGLDVNTPFAVNDITSTGYDGQYVVSKKTSATEFQYEVSNAPANPLPTVTGSTVNLAVDTVTGSSPYIFNCSLRSVYGMCGLLADGDKCTGFKSMVVAQYTGIGLQKDNNAFVKYDSTSGTFKDSTSIDNLHNDSKAIFKPAYSNWHIKAENDALLQLVSVFAIGYAQHFVVDTGGDFSITNSNSNFGAKALVAAGFKRNSFARDDVGYLTHIIPPKEIEASDVAIEFNALDVEKTVVGVASTSRLYLYDQTNEAVLPDSVLEGYRVGAKENDKINVLISSSGITTQYSARIVMPNTELSTNTLASGQVSYQKEYDVGRTTAGINSITSNILTLKTPHNLLSGESIRVIAENGHLPDGLETNVVYYAITAGVSTDQIKVAKTLNDSINGDPVTINSKGGILKIESRVSDKISGDIGHPIQYDTDESQWYITVGTASTDNDIFPTLVGLGTTSLGDSTPRTFIKRKPDTRNVIDTIYRARYVLPAGSGITSARPPIEGYVVEESSDVTGLSDTEVQTYFSPTTVSLSNVSEQRNFSFLAHARWLSNEGYYLTELPHKMKVGSTVLVENVTSANNTTGVGNSGYNGTFKVTGITSAREFIVDLSSTTGPGTFTNDTSSRTTSLPTFTQKKYAETFSIYRAQEVQKYSAGKQDGIYNILILNNSNKPTISPFSTERFSQPIQYLYPQTNRDNPKSDPSPAASFVLADPVGQTVVDDAQSSITRESLNEQIFDASVGFGITEIKSNSAGTAHTIYTTIDHGLNRVTTIGIAHSGGGYGSGTSGYLYNAKLVSSGAATTQGQNATARIQVNDSGNIVAAKIMDGGSAYAIGDSLQIVGVGTTAPHTVGVVTVTNIYNNVGDTLRLTGIVPDSNSEFNSLYEITDITVGAATTILVSSASTIGAASTLGIGKTDLEAASAYLTGISLDVTSLNYNATTGVGILTTKQRHGLQVDNKVQLGGADAPLYRGNFIVKKINDQTSFNLNIGVATVAPGTSGTIVAYPAGYVARGGNVSIESENLGGRQITQYAGITTTLGGAILTESTDSIEITEIDTLDINIGDFLEIGSEIVRVKTTVSGTGAISVFRGVLGTKAKTHVNNTIVRKIDCRPIELRRNSIIRASGHTFEYVGFGPGNYSTAFPDRQDRSLSPQEELLAQSTKKDGGINVYTGMNDSGDFYIGNKKVSSATGTEEVFDAPVPSVTGEDIRSTTAGGGINIGFDVLTPLEASISRSLRVEGGPSGNIISEFDGPVVFNNKLTSTSSKGIEAESIYLQGDATVSRKHTVGVSTPTSAGNPGDLVYNANPASGQYSGWMFTADNNWHRFGYVSISTNSNCAIFDRVGIATTTPGLNTLQVGAGASVFTVDGTGVGIGTTANAYKLQVIGNTNIVGYLTASYLKGDGSGITNLSNDTLFSPTDVGLGTGIYPIGNLRVGIGTTVPQYNLDLGTTGTGSTDLYVRNTTFLAGFTTTKDLQVGGALTATTYSLDSSTSNIVAGIVTCANIVVGGALSTSSGEVGLGTDSPRAKLDIEGSTKFKTYSEYVGVVTSVGNNVSLDLSVAQSFTLTVAEAVSQFTLLNPPTGSTAFTVKILQDSTGYSVGIDTFKNASSGEIAVYWPGGTVPTVTVTAEKTDIYSFMTFDGGSSLYGVVGGQNFA